MAALPSIQEWYKDGDTAPVFRFLQSLTPVSSNGSRRHSKDDSSLSPRDQDFQVRQAPIFPGEQYTLDSNGAWKHFESRLQHHTQQNSHSEATTERKIPRKRTSAQALREDSDQGSSAETKEAKKAKNSNETARRSIHTGSIKQIQDSLERIGVKYDEPGDSMLNKHNGKQLKYSKESTLRKAARYMSSCAEELEALRSARTQLEEEAAAGRIIRELVLAFMRLQDDISTSSARCPSQQEKADLRRTFDSAKQELSRLLESFEMSKAESIWAQLQHLQNCLR